MADMNDVVIVGGGLAGAKAAEAARETGFSGRLTLLGDEPVRPYERPPLSKAFLVGDASRSDVFVHGEEFYDDHDVALHLDDPVAAVDRSSHEVVTTGGRRHRYDRLLLATGAQPRRLPLDGAQLAGVHVLRTLNDSVELAGALKAANHVVVIGAGWIGCEVAAAARRLDAQVTMVDPLDVPLQRVLGHEVGRIFASLHTDNGVDLRMGVGVSSLRGNESVDAVALTDGTTVETDAVVVGIGVVPRTQLAEDAGLDVDDGIVTDATLRSSDPDIFAAGDVASAHHPLFGRRLRVEHWANALNQGTTAGRNLAGGDEAYERVPYFYSDQYDLGMEYVGYADRWDEVVFRGSPEDREFVAFWTTGGRVVAAMNCNVWDVVEDLKALIMSQQAVDADRLRDPDIPLGEI